jgi:lipid-A-disaccharide synthase
VLPGSRKQEIVNMLEVMVGIVPRFADEYQFVVAGMSVIPKEYYASVEGLDSVKIVLDQTYDLLNVATAAIVTSGTATLETALFGVPQVVCYRTSRFTYVIAKALVKLKFISLVNLIAGREVVKELIQGDFSSEPLAAEVMRLASDQDYRARIVEDYHAIQEQIGYQNASENTAKQILAALS